MRKLPLLFFCVIILLSGCSAVSEPPADKFKADFSASYKGVKLKGKIYSPSNSALTVTLISPKPMRGYVYKYERDKLSLSYDNMNIKSSVNYLPESDFTKSVYNVIKSLKKENNLKTVNSYNSYTEYKGGCESGVYTIKAENSSGFIKNISLKENKIEIKLFNTKAIN